MISYHQKHPFEESVNTRFAMPIVGDGFGGKESHGRI
jgi:hypothetical protein